MKKFVLTLITLLSALSFTFGVAGCGNNNDGQTSTDGSAPVIKPLEENEERHERSTLPVFEWDFDKFGSQYKMIHEETLYEDFLNYVNSDYREVCDETFCLWKPVESIPGEYNSEGYRYGDSYNANGLSAVQDEVAGRCNGTYLYQAMIIYSEEWENKDFNNICNAELVLVSGAVELTDDEDEFEIFIFEGKNYTQSNLSVYANIYLGETCVATCYAYSSFKYCSLSWVEDYLKTHLMISKVKNI